MLSVSVQSRSASTSVRNAFRRAGPAAFTWKSCELVGAITLIGTAAATLALQTEVKGRYRCEALCYFPPFSLSPRSCHRSPPPRRPGIACRDGFGATPAIASSRPMSNAPPRHPGQMPIATLIRDMLSRVRDIVTGTTGIIEQGFWRERCGRGSRQADGE